MPLPYKDWNSFSIYFSADYSRVFLKKCYQNLRIENADQKSFENCYPFIHYLEHGRIYYNQAATSPIHIQPILLFYGLVHLVKACILTVAPDYPETTSVLAHGLSTRKRKKQQYSFLEDEVKFQKHGLFPLMAEKLFHMKQLEGDKVKMGDILKYIPELTPLHSQLNGEKTFLTISSSASHFSVPKTVLDHFHMTENRFMDYFHSKSKAPITYHHSHDEKISFEMDLTGIAEPVPLKFNINDNHFSFPLCRGDLFSLPELLLHYLLLYNLGMIARYEIDWWSELIKMMPNEDYPFIQSFLDITLRKGPFLIHQFLSNK
ncbi:YaaC family protein [Mesobacillus foraminis]|uniref:YaaC family protein n=1 Tax=Mesobacillus foraminis TaxID=279826 RepID=UPI0039A2AC37